MCTSCYKNCHGVNCMKCKKVKTTDVSQLCKDCLPTNGGCAWGTIDKDGVYRPCENWAYIKNGFKQRFCSQCFYDWKGFEADA